MTATTVPLLCQIFRIYPEADPGGDGREVAIHLDVNAPQPAVLWPTGGPGELVFVSLLNGYLIAQRDGGQELAVQQALDGICAALEASSYVHVAERPEMREFVSDDPEEVSMLLGRAGRLN